MLGPRKTVTHSCFSCEACVSESYKVQGDSGHDVYCIHPKALSPNAVKRFIADTSWDTPAWCPLLATPQQSAPDGAEGE